MNRRKFLKYSCMISSAFFIAGSIASYPLMKENWSHYSRFSLSPLEGLILRSEEDDSKIRKNIKKRLESVKNPIEISKYSDLMKIGHHQNYPLNGDYIQVSDIDCGRNFLEPIGNSPEVSEEDHLSIPGLIRIGPFPYLWSDEKGMLTPIRESEASSEVFTGTYNGNGKVISNFSIKTSNDCDKSLFHMIGRKGLLANIKLKNVNIEGKANLSALVNYNLGCLYNCSLEDSEVIGSSAAGMIGVNVGNVLDCSVKGNSKISLGIKYPKEIVFDDLKRRYIDPTTKSEIDVPLNTGTGGIVLLNYFGGRLIGCFVGENVKIEGWSNVGGNVARSSSSILKNCYSRAKIKGYESVGGNAGIAGNSVFFLCNPNSMHNIEKVGNEDSFGEMIGHAYQNVLVVYPSKTTFSRKWIGHSNIQKELRGTDLIPSLMKNIRVKYCDEREFKGLLKM